MEAHGVSNRIHASKETADLLKMSGKGHWVIPRKEKIQAKVGGYDHDAGDTLCLQLINQIHSNLG